VSHTSLTHVPLREVEHEVAESKKKIEERVGRRVFHFAYPNGDYNEQIMTIVENNGFSSACALASGEDGENPFALKRKCVHEGLTKGIFTRFSQSLFAAEIAGIFAFFRSR
jgi:peptidoglycan/xylan/chitin deacetylase (PgdA/CDA1 family)